MSSHTTTDRGFFDEFEFKGTHYIAHIKHYLEVSEEEVIGYRMVDGEYLVHLFSKEVFVTFKVYLDVNLVWKNASSRILIADELVEVVGIVIDMKQFYE